ncbi:hypothetical protein, partial [Streptomyces sp. NPDC057676]
ALATALAAGALPPAARAAAPAPPAVERVSVAADGGQADAASDSATVSGDGHHVAFRSWATNLVPGARRGGPEVFLKDLRTGTVEQVNVATDGTPVEGQVFSFALSHDARHVAFASLVEDRGPDGSLPRSEIHVRDRVTGRTEPLLPPGTRPSGITDRPSISADGRHVAFSSTRDDLVPGDTNSWSDVFVHDRGTGVTRRVSVGDDGSQLTGFSTAPTLSADGGRVAFRTVAGPDAAPSTAFDAAHRGSRPSARQLYVHDLRTGRTVPGAPRGEGGSASVYGGAGLSRDGRHALYCTGTALVPEDTNDRSDAYATDLATGRVRRLSLAYDGAEADHVTLSEVHLSADARRAFFTSSASNLVPDDTNGHQDAFVRDLRTGDVRRLDVAPDGAQSDGPVGGTHVDTAGRTVAFGSDAGNLVPDDTNGVSDVFVHRLPPPRP